MSDMNMSNWPLPLPLQITTNTLDLIGIDDSPTPTASSIVAATDRGDGEKILAMAVLGLGSFLSGMLPAIISERNRHRFPLTTSLLLCFGAGILLATALVHILPEVRKQMSSNYAEIALCGGFFIIYFIDEFIHYFFGEAIQHTHAAQQQRSDSSGSIAALSSSPSNSNAAITTFPQNTNRNYGATNDESKPLLQTQQDATTESYVAHPLPATAGTNSHSHGHSHSHCTDEIVADANARLCHTSHTEPCAQTMTGTLGLFAALSLHSAIEGIAIGVQNSATKVLFLLGAVACHKFVMGFCLGLEFRSNPRTSLRAQLLGIGVFALGAVCGIGIGMLVVDMPSNWTNTALPVIQALAGGTLFYVTVCEVIPREKARWHQNPSRKAAGFAQLFAVASGFVAMTVLNYYFDDDA